MGKQGCAEERRLFATTLETGLVKGIGAHLAKSAKTLLSAAHPEPTSIRGLVIFSFLFFYCLEPAIGLFFIFKMLI